MCRSTLSNAQNPRPRLSRPGVPHPTHPPPHPSTHSVRGSVSVPHAQPWPVVPLRCHTGSRLSRCRVLRIAALATLLTDFFATLRLGTSPAWPIDPAALCDPRRAQASARRHTVASAFLGPSQDRTIAHRSCSVLANVGPLLVGLPRSSPSSDPLSLSTYTSS